MKRNLLLLSGMIIVLLTGCTKDQPENREKSAEMKIFGKESVTDTVSEELLFNVGKIFSIVDEVFLAIDTKAKKFNFDEDNITNFEEVLGIFKVPEYVSREIMVGSYSENFPVELQEILVHCNDDIDAEEDKDWQKYEVDCKIITSEDIANADKIGDYLGFRPAFALDIDGDGTNEYATIRDEGHGAAFSVIKNVEGEWMFIGGNSSPDRTAIFEVLAYEDRYYLLMGDELSRWDDEAGIPDRKYWNMNDAVPGQADCWNALTIRKTVTGYVPYETYSSLPEDSPDCLEDIDLISLAGINGEKEKPMGRGLWSFNGWFFWLEYGWEQECDGETYLYVIADMNYGKQGAGDKLLAVLHETEDEKKEIVKVYYLAANYDIQIKER